MKMTHEELGAFIVDCPNLYSARSNGDVETIANEARAVLQDDSITHDDVRKAAEVYHAKVTAARAAPPATE